MDKQRLNYIVSFRKILDVKTHHFSPLSKTTTLIFLPFLLKLLKPDCSTQPSRASSNNTHIHFVSALST